METFLLSQLTVHIKYSLVHSLRLADIILQLIFCPGVHRLLCTIDFGHAGVHFMVAIHWSLYVLYLCHCCASCCLSLLLNKFLKLCLFCVSPDNGLYCNKVMIM